MSKKQKNIEDTKKFVSLVANKQGWKLNSDDEFIGDIIEGLMVNYNRYGFYMCPCRDSWGEREKDKDIMCPCDYCKPDQEEYGHCFCGLYLTDAFFGSGKTPTSIPDRRPDELFPE
jgi:ferredoxin-thioredoxin reductase catalytic subunit